MSIEDTSTSVGDKNSLPPGIWATVVLNLSIIVRQLKDMISEIGEV